MCKTTLVKHSCNHYTSPHTRCPSNPPSRKIVDCPVKYSIGSGRSSEICGSCLPREELRQREKREIWEDAFVAGVLSGGLGSGALNTISSGSETVEVRGMGARGLSNEGGRMTRAEEERTAMGMETLVGLKQGVSQGDGDSVKQWEVGVHSQDILRKDSGIVMDIAEHPIVNEDEDSDRTDNGLTEESMAISTEQDERNNDEEQPPTWECDARNWMSWGRK